ncbi:MAG: hypothetical protein AAFY88_12580, partial [Acidobacteriota bacterium]
SGAAVHIRRRGGVHRRRGVGDVKGRVGGVDAGSKCFRWRWRPRVRAGRSVGGRRARGLGVLTAFGGPGRRVRR